MYVDSAERLIHLGMSISPKLKKLANLENFMLGLRMEYLPLIVLTFWKETRVK